MLSEYQRMDPAPTLVLPHSRGKYLSHHSAANLVFLPPEKKRKEMKRKGFFFCLEPSAETAAVKMENKHKRVW